MVGKKDSSPVGLPTLTKVPITSSHSLNEAMNIKSQENLGDAHLNVKTIHFPDAPRKSKICPKLNVFVIYPNLNKF